MANQTIKRFVIKDEHGNILKQDAFSVVGDVHVSVDGGVGEPSAESEYAEGELTITLHNLKGEGISDISFTPSEEDGGENLLTITTDGGHTYTFVILNGSKGDDGEKGDQGIQGLQGTSAIWNGNAEVLTELEHTLGNATNRTMSQKGITDQMKKVVDLTGDEIYLNLASYPTNACSVGSGGKWYKASGGNQCHYAIPVLPVQKYRIVNSDSTSGLRYAFVTSDYDPPYSNNNTIPVASDHNKAVSVGTSSIVTAPTDAAYLCINKIAGSGVEISSNLYYVGSQSVGGIEYRSPIAVDLSEAAENPRPCSHGTDTWYMSGSLLNQAHIAIAVEPGKTYKIRVKDGGTFAAVLTDAYDPTVSYSSGAPMPLASCNSERIVVQGWRYITIPEDGAFLTMTTVDGGGNPWEWEVYEVTPVEVGLADAPKDVPVKFRVMQWNVGNWGMGEASPTLTPAEFDAKKMLYRQMIESAAADVICCCEWEEYVDTESQGKAKDVLFSNYDSLVQAPGTGQYMRTAILSNGLKLTRIQRTEYAQSAARGRYYSTATFRINGHDVKIVATHLDSNYSGNQGEAYAEQCRLSQMRELITAFANDQYVVLCADYNVADRPEEYEIFKKAGYDMANCGYLGILDTYHFYPDTRGDLPIDNIIFKGFKGSKIEVYDKFNPELPPPNRELSDHSPIAITLTMIE